MHSKSTVLSSLAILALLFVSCSEKSQEIRTPDESAACNADGQKAVPGIMIVKFLAEPDESTISELEASGKYTFTRSYPPSERFEERHRKSGLHLYYNVTFNPQIPLTKAENDLSSLSCLEFATTVPPVKSTAAFNDPRLSEQWHYENKGTKAGSIAGCDVNAVAAWDIETGSPNVVVAVSDGGVDFTHPDLAQNMWINTMEYNGIAGVDDDGNGYVDDVYGYSFLVNQPQTDNPGHIVFDNHGTHIAGTIAAVNNNAEGVCGIAGGNGTPGSGVRIMTVQTSNGEAYLDVPFVYAADNGAVLINCSWTLTDYSFSYMKVMRDVISYFNEYAGMDEHGNQVGPMAGGVIFFASGNDNTDDTSWPANEPGVVAVSSIANDFRRAYYSNYGDYVDISAPGGDAMKSAQIMSTLPEGGYGLMQGTSMACPHAVGVAALIVSHFQGQGFTRQNLIDILCNTAKPIDNYNPSYEGKLGAGLVDAYAAVSCSTLTPERPSAVSASINANIVSLSWKHPDSSPFKYEVFYSKESLVGLNPENPAAGVSVISVPAAGIAPGENVNCILDGLTFDTSYHVRIRSKSIIGVLSDLTDDIVITTRSNNAPVITAVGSTTIDLLSFESTDVFFEVYDPDGHAVTCSVSPAKTKLTYDGNTAAIHISAIDFDDNATHVVTLSATDSYSTTEQQITLRIAANNPPGTKAQIGDFVLSDFTSNTTLDLSQYFTDADGEQLTYSIMNKGTGTLVSATVAGSIITFKPIAYGSASFSVTATDARNASVSQNFSILIRDGSRQVELYPNPVKDNLYIRTGEEDSVDILITNRAGAKVFEAKGQSVGPFSPLVLDLSTLKNGVYYLKYSGSTASDTFSITKK